MSSIKERHYQQLSSKLQILSKELEKTHRQFDSLAEYLHALNNLGVAHAAQFMAVSRILDAEMTRGEGDKDTSSPR